MAKTLKVVKITVITWGPLLHAREENTQYRELILCWLGDECILMKSVGHETVESAWFH